MATQLVPYTSAMKFESSFNSFTQTLCIDNAVVRDPDPVADVKEALAAGETNVAQSVIYKTSIIEKATDVVKATRIKPAFEIKYGGLDVLGSGNFVDRDTMKDSDVSIVVSCRVANQTIYDHSLVKFQPVHNIKDASAQCLVEVYGDSFISASQEGGEFLAVLSVKAKNRSVVLRFRVAGCTCASHMSAYQQQS